MGRVNISTVHLDTSGMIDGFQLIAAIDGFHLPSFIDFVALQMK
jgi:hypothetical protein